MPDMEQLELNGVVYDVRDPTKAPAGYGLGEVKAKYADTPEDITESGFYRSIAPSVTSGTAWYTCVSYGASLKTVLGFNETFDGLAFMRTMKNGVWGEWEWANPPMSVGVEYRTTERWNGKAVYTVLINPGTSVEGVLSVATEITCAEIIRWGGKCGGYVLPFINGTLDNAYSCWAAIYKNGSYIKVSLHCGSSAAGLTPYIQVWYTKD